jgi:hypothetical protein
MARFASVVFTGDGAGSFRVDNIPQNGRALKITFQIQSTSGSGANIGLQINDDTSSLYHKYAVTSSGSSAFGRTGDSQAPSVAAIGSCLNGLAAECFSIGEITIPYYADPNSRKAGLFSSGSWGGSTSFAQLTGMWAYRNTTRITVAELVLDAGVPTANSRMDVYIIP